MKIMVNHLFDLSSLCFALPIKYHGIKSAAQHFKASFTLDNVPSKSTWKQGLSGGVSPDSSLKALHNAM